MGDAALLDESKQLIYENNRLRSRLHDIEEVLQQNDQNYNELDNKHKVALEENRQLEKKLDQERKEHLFSLESANQLRDDEKQKFERELAKLRQENEQIKAATVEVSFEENSPNTNMGASFVTEDEQSGRSYAEYLELQTVNLTNDHSHLEQTVRSLQEQLVETCQENTKLKAECEEVLRLRDESTTTLLPKTGDDNSSLTVVAAPIGGTYVGGMFGVAVGMLLVFAFLLYCLCLRPVRFVIDAVHLNSLYNKHQLI
ncbi:unnamed protein product, partial [Mesorhabditis spiculigera]